MAYPGIPDELFLKLMPYLDIHLANMVSAEREHVMAHVTQIQALCVGDGDNTRVVVVYTVDNESDPRELFSIPGEDVGIYMVGGEPIYVEP